jgi:predicted nucleic acid-binding protein
MLVIDASAVSTWLFRGRAAAKVESHIAEAELAAPYIFDLEVLSAIRRAVSAGQLPSDHARNAVIDLLELGVERYGHEVLLPRIWFLRDNFTPYDAAYLALAEALADDGVPLLTSDARFARAAHKHSDVEVLLAA